MYPAPPGMAVPWREAGGGARVTIDLSSLLAVRFDVTRAGESYTGRLTLTVLEGERQVLPPPVPGGPTRAILPARAAHPFQLEGPPYLVVLPQPGVHFATAMTTGAAGISESFTAAVGQVGVARIDLVEREQAPIAPFSVR